MEANQGMPTYELGKDAQWATFMETTVAETLEQRILTDVVEKAGARLVVMGDWEAGDGDGYVRTPQESLGRNLARRELVLELAPVEQF